MTSKKKFRITPSTKKRLVRGLFALTLGTVLLTGLLIGAPLIVESRMFKTRLVALVSDRIGGRLDYDTLHLTLIPFPSLTMRHPSVRLASGLDARAEALSVAIRCLPLLKGAVQLRELVLDSPWVRFPLAGSAPAPSTGREEGVATVSKDQIARIINSLEAIAGGAVVRIRDGRLNLLDDEGVFAAWEEIALTYTATAAQMKLQAAAASAAFGNLTADLLVEPVSLDMGGKVAVSEIHVSKLVSLLLPSTPVSAPEGTLDMEIRFTAQKLDTFDLHLSAAAPTLALERNGRTLPFEDLEVEAEIQRQAEGWKIELDALRVVQPAVALSGTAMRSESSGWTVELAAQPIDIAPLRSQALEWGGDLAWVVPLFDILRDGRIQELSARASADTLKELASLKQITATAQIGGGGIRIPATDLEVTEISGRIDLDQGNLSAGVDAARMIGTRLTDGRYSMNLIAPALPLQAKIGIRSDLGRLSELLAQTVDAQTRHSIVAELQELEGTVRGRFQISGPIADLRWTAHVDELGARLKSPRLPMLIQIDTASARYADAVLTVDRLKGRVGRSTVDDISGRLVFGETPRLHEASGRLDLDLGELFAWASYMQGASEVLRRVNRLDGRAIVSDIAFSGPLNALLSGDFSLRGRLERVRAEVEGLPAPLLLSSPDVRGATDHIQATDLTVALAETELTATAILKAPFSDRRTLELSAEGIIGPGIIRRALATSGAADWVRIDASVAVPRLSLVSDLKVRHTIHTALQPIDGPALVADVEVTPERISIPVLTVKDTYSDARFTFDMQAGALTADYGGRLDLRSFRALTTDKLTRSGWIEGRLHATRTGKAWLDSRLTGQLEGGEIIVGLPDIGGDSPPIIDNFAIAATGNRIEVRTAALHWDKMGLELDGWLARAETGLEFDLRARSPFMDVDELLAAVGSREEGAARSDSRPTAAETDWRRPRRGEPLTGELRLEIDHLNYGPYNLRPVHTSIRADSDQLTINIHEADLCTVSLPGSVHIDSEGVKLQLHPSASTPHVGQAMTCLLQNPIRADGKLYLAGDLTADAPPEHLIAALDGSITLTISDGRIYKANLLTTIMDLVNTTEIFVEQGPDLTKEGLAYRKIEFEGSFDRGILTVDTCSMDAASLQMSCAGQVDLTTQKADLTFLVAPLRTVDRVVENLPIISYVLDDTLLSIPIRVKGPISDPQVRFISPKAVGEGALNMMKRTFQVPFKVLQPHSSSREGGDQ